MRWLDRIIAALKTALAIKDSAMAEAKKYLGNIWIHDAYPAYHREVKRYLKLIQTTHAGRTLINAITMRPRWMLIAPFKPTAQSPVNAYAYPSNNSRLDSRPPSYEEKLTIPVPMLGPVTVVTGRGTGIGSFVQVDFHPATWTERAVRAGGIAPGAGPGEVLYHEMLHGCRMMSGLLSDDKVTSNPEMDDIEEFFAILGANVYRSERGFSKLRASHHGFRAIRDATRIDEVYYDEYKMEIDRWFTEQRAFCLAMAQSTAKFNPFREAAIAKGLMSRPATAMRLPA
ncbi:MAG: hypothetical protein ACRCTD_00180 [Beijerinckiaceae bacterium]